MVARTVTRAHLAAAVYREIGLSQSESARLVEALLAEVIDGLARGEAVKISSFEFLLTLENPPLEFYVFLVFGMKEVTAMGWSAWRPVASDGAKGDGLGASVRMSYLLGASGVQAGEGLERMSMLTAYHW